jgi:hypothetical protein
VLTNTPRCANKHTFSQNTPKGVLFSGQANNTPKGVLFDLKMSLFISQVNQSGVLQQHTL